MQQLEIFDNWKKDCLAKKEQYIDFGSPIMNAALQGCNKETSILIAGAANNGKSQLLTSTVINILQNNDDVCVLDFSFDDGIRKRITQYTANLSRLSMNTVDYANDIEDYVSKNKFDDACKMISSWVGKGSLQLFDYDLDTRCTIQSVENKVKEYANREKVIVIIDSINDVDASRSNLEDLQKAESVAKEINLMLTRTKATLIASTHLRKTGSKRPTLEDIKGNNFLGYSAKAIIGIYNDLKINKDRAKVNWRLKKEGQEIVMPIIEAHFLKSKVSDYNDVICFKQFPAQGRCVEADGESQAVLKDIIYGSI